MPFHGSNRGSNPLGDASLVVEIRGAGFLNKGAELMLQAAVAQLHDRFPNCVICVAPTRNSGPMPISKIREHRLHIKLAKRKWGIQWGALGALLPRVLRRRLGLVLSSELSAILDASGFAYADKWPLSNLEELADLATDCRRHGTRLIFLPQAFGPFSDQPRQSMMRDSADAASMIFARDTRSLEYLQQVCSPRVNLRLAPDFTNLVASQPPTDISTFNDVVALVPNRRMLDKANATIGAAYVDFMVAVGRHVCSLGYRVVVVVHELQLDAQLARDIAARIDGAVTLSEADPLRLKGVFGACRCVISSRYHALIAALSQGVPAFGTSWSHKYPALFGEYDFERGLLDATNLDDALEIVTETLHEPRYSSLRAHLDRKADELREQSRQMWSDVFASLERRS